MRRLTLIGWLVATAILVSGCDDLALPPAETAAPASKSSGNNGSTAQQDADEYAADEYDAEGDNDADSEGEYEREVAQAGVGKKGRNYGGGVITEPVKQYFQVSQRIHFMNMQKAMSLYKGEHGYLPKTHEEFMDKIIKVNAIELPELPDGQRYVYDPKRGELMVEKPKR